MYVTLWKSQFLGSDMMKYHIQVISNEMPKAIGVMAKLKSDIPKLTLLQIHNTLILFRLNYALKQWNKIIEKKTTHPIPSETDQTN